MLARLLQTGYGCWVALLLVLVCACPQEADEAPIPDHLRQQIKAATEATPPGSPSDAPPEPGWDPSEMAFPSQPRQQALSQLLALSDQATEPSAPPSQRERAAMRELAYLVGRSLTDPNPLPLDLLNSRGQPLGLTVFHNTSPDGEEAFLALEEQLPGGGPGCLLLFRTQPLRPRLAPLMWALPRAAHLAHPQLARSLFLRSGADALLVDLRTEPAAQRSLAPDSVFHALFQGALDALAGAVVIQVDLLSADDGAEGVQLAFTQGGTHPVALATRDVLRRRLKSVRLLETPPDRGGAHTAFAWAYSDDLCQRWWVDARWLQGLCTDPLTEEATILLEVVGGLRLLGE